MWQGIRTFLNLEKQRQRENSRKSETLCQQHLEDKKQYLQIILFRCKSSVCLELLRVKDILKKLFEK